MLIYHRFISIDMPRYQYLVEGDEHKNDELNEKTDKIKKIRKLYRWSKDTRQLFGLKRKSY